MSTHPTTPPSPRSAALHLVDTHPATVEALGHEPETRPALARLCAGEPLLLLEDEIDLLSMLNNAHDVIDHLLPDDVDPDNLRLAEILLEFLCHRYGIERHADGDRVSSVESIYLRHLMPFLIERDFTRPAGQRGVAQLRIGHLEALPQVLAGDRLMPAATVAADLLDRRGAACVYLSVPDAARVIHGGPDALEHAVATGEVGLHVDARSGASLVRAADLRGAGLLMERQEPHGLAKATANNVLRDLKQAIERARDHGASVRGTFRLHAIEPLQDRRLRPPKPERAYVTLSTIAATNDHMRIIGQVVLWIGRLVGERISEIYGLLVSDYYRDPDGRPWLHINKQGGKSSMVRDPENGQFAQQDRKDGTKTPAGTRDVPIPAPLAALLDAQIAIFHTDPVTGEVDSAARLIPGIQQTDVSGQSAFRTWLKEAQQVTGERFDPHDLRGALITDLMDAGIDARVAHYYAGQELPNPTIQDRKYDRGPAQELLLEVTDVLEARIRSELGTTDLRVPTALRESWGRGTRHHAQRDLIEAQLVADGWRAPGEAAPGLGRLMSVRETARAAGKSEPHTRRMMSSGAIVSHTRRWGVREVRVAWEVDVNRYVAAISGPTLTEVALELDWTYNQAWHHARRLRLIDPGHAAGRTLRLSQQAVQQLRDEAAQRSEVGADTLSIREAADELDMEVVTVETLVRQGKLEVVDPVSGTRARLVTRRSVEAYNEEFPAEAMGSEAPIDTGPLLTMTQTREFLGLTRTELTSQVSTRRLRTAPKPGSRHLYVPLASALGWARAQRRTTSEARLLEYATGALSAATIDVGCASGEGHPDLRASSGRTARSRGRA